ncbi:hypothetical protein [Streptomyces sp. H39-S7]|uniref:hypothetical protein n=1 Tax=Streptomyces sp. H39-S7 TaxID=3004357 RepID=UPI0022AE84A1|nr:hypothetical protein [Streptomyces sp. H39-S7]MCZ4119041.1 hypothetical protein [Streptomyces sp. H39-S7]
MAEVSYPFNASNASGGQSQVQQTQWQSMSHMWGGDRIDFRATASTYVAGTLPFSLTSLGGRNFAIVAGSAWVGGFYYTLTSSITLAIDPNLTAQARKDTIVIRADLTLGSVNIVVVKGQPSASPVAPRPQRNPGGQWEMVLYEMTVPANNGAVSANGRFQYDMPTVFGSPWDLRETMDYAEVGSFGYDMDSDGGDSQNEAFKSRDGYVITRHLGKSRTYTPSLAQSATQPATRSGRWRWIAPNTVWFTATLQNTVTSDIVRSGSNFQFGVSLPVPANGKEAQILTGYVNNNPPHAKLPNFISLTVVLPKGNPNSNAFLWYPNPGTTAEGLDGFNILPGLATMTISGVYEANAFAE